MTFGELSSAASVILVLIGGLLVIMNFIDKIRSWLKPVDEKSKYVRDKIVAHEERLDHDHKRLNRLEEDMKMTLRTLNDMMEHMITGNGIDKMRKTHDDLTDYILKR